MGEVIDIGVERDRREGPDAEFVRKDDFGRQMFTYLLSYEMGGSRWSVEVWGYSFDDAQARVEAMRETLKLDGQAFTVVPA